MELGHKNFKKFIKWLFKKLKCPCKYSTWSHSLLHIDTREVSKTLKVPVKWAHSEESGTDKTEFILIVIK